MCKVSVIIAIYQAEVYLRKCLDALCNQTFSDFEAILVDDGSYDNSPAICDEYAANDFRIKVIHKENEGVSVARQIGLEASKGEYVIHVDPDDWIEPDMLDQLYKKAKQDNADMVICDFFWNRPTGQQYSVQCPSSERSDVVLRELCSDKLHGAVWNKLTKRSLFYTYNVKFPKEASFCEDLFVNISLLRHDIKVVYLNKAFYHYVLGVNANGISQGVKQPYSYDLMMLNKVDKLFSGDPLHKYAYSCFSAHLLDRAYKRHEFSNWQFCKNCIPYCFKIIDRPISTRLKFIFSCLGLYRILLKISNIHRRIKQR